jgi:hypothetical protein
MRCVLLLSSVIALGCAGNFAIPASEVPNLDRGSVRTVDGDTAAVPARWSARVVHTDPDGGRWMRPGEAPAALAFVPDERVDEAEDQGYREAEIQFGAPLEGGIGPYGSATLPPLAREAAREASPDARRVLWVRDQEGKLVELPLESIERIEIEDVDARERRKSGGRAAWITGAVVGGALVAVLVVVGLSAWSASAPR